MAEDKGKEKEKEKEKENKLSKTKLFQVEKNPQDGQNKMDIEK